MPGVQRYTFTKSDSIRILIDLLIPTEYNYDVEKAYEAIWHVQIEPGRAHPCGGLVGNTQLKK